MAQSILPPKQPAVEAVIIPVHMSFRLELDSVNKVVRLSFRGEVTNELLWDGYEALKNGFIKYDPDHCIVDYSEATKMKISSEHVRYLASNPPAFTPRERLKFVVAPRGAVYGGTRVFQILSENHPNFRVVRTVEEVLDFLNVKSPKFETMEARWPFTV